MRDTAEIEGLEIRGAQIILRELRTSDVGETYRGWMNDPEVVRFTASRGQSYSLDDLKQFVARTAEDDSNLFMAILAEPSGGHIGNIKLGPIDRTNRSAKIGIIIGAKDFWGRGLATDAIRCISQHAFDDIGLHKVSAGCYRQNNGSITAFERAGFEIEGVLRESAFFEGAYTDEIILGLVNPEQG